MVQSVHIGLDLPAKNRRFIYIRKVVTD